MIPIAIEPTRLAYETYCSSKGCSATSSETVVRFLRDIGDLFTNLEQHGLGVAVTTNLKKEYSRQFPYIGLAGSGLSGSARAAAKTSVELYRRRLDRYQTVHKYGEHGLDMTINSGTNDPSNMLTTNITYFEWVDLLGLALLNLIPPFVLSSPEATVFSADVCLVEETTSKRSALVHVSSAIDSPCADQGLAIWRLAHCICSGVEPASYKVPCSGTGTHASMWGCAVRSLGDVGEPERKLLEGLAALGIVKEYRLLAFPRAYGATPNPAIESLRVKNEYVLMGHLHGKGTKQHAQEIEIHLRLDCATQLKAAMGDSVDAAKLSRIESAVRQLRRPSGRASHRRK